MSSLQVLIGEEPRFADLTLARLVDAAGVSRTSFYKYFDSKIDVLSIWLDELIDLVVQAARAWPADGPPTRALLAQGLQDVVAVCRPRMKLISAVYETGAHDAELRAQLTSALSNAQHAVEKHIALGQGGGWVNPAIDEAELARWLVYLTENGIRRIIGPGPESRISESVAAWTDIVWNTLYGQFSC
ncbi:TetR/AcrR family transcriptional regulator [Mycobacterium sp. E1747]|uniref:TetR/AcrR family transcriptional regulator n=1 Tax=Mycobacterium sp. E1747 TaxID=1834128 RepID=UPI0018D2A2D7|nr:TetR/AcrR family transcriptional regulator [Mycobacterium sp. E1747]